MQVMLASVGDARTCLRIHVADTWPLRFRGLLGRPSPAANEGLLITRCKAVHTLWMGYPIDVVFLDRDWRVVGVNHSVRPGRWKVAARRGSGAVQVLELRDGSAHALGLHPGAQLRRSHAREHSASVSLMAIQ